MGRLLVDLRNEWGVQVLVLFSFSLQVFLLMFASIRRYNVSLVPRFLLWLAYQLADSTALFTLGHMAISSRPQEEQPLMAFWAPFLLVHLGGQDTISAYSFEDNRLWLRHLQTLVVQVLGASYVLYKYTLGDDMLLMAAAVLIFTVGILKYGERILALRSASFDSMWSSLDELDASSRESRSNELLAHALERRFRMDEETILMGAHGLLEVCLGLFIGMRRGRRQWLREAMRSFKMYGHLDKVMEMELSLMYDMLYTKAVVIHTWYGCCIRVIALVATVAAFLLFQLSGGSSRGTGHIGHHGHSSKDLAVTHVLLVGALLLELASMVRAIGSTWTCALLYQSEEDRKYHSRHWKQHLHWEITKLRRTVGATRHRRWSGFVGQYNLLKSCAKDAARAPIYTDTKRWLGCSQLGRVAEKWWDELEHSWSTELSDTTKELVLMKILHMGTGGEEVGSLPGLLTLKELNLEGHLGWSIHDMGFEDSIMAWHLATEICIFFGDRSTAASASASADDGKSSSSDLLEAIRVLSNYMMFLLVLRPYMLPGPVRRSRYNQFHHDLLDELMMEAAAAHHHHHHHHHRAGRSTKWKSPQELLDWSLRKGFHARIHSDVPHKYFDAGVTLADALFDRPNPLEVIFGVWVEMLCYVANHCSRESHARQLSMGGELVTVVWLMARHASLSFIV